MKIRIAEKDRDLLRFVWFDDVFSDNPQMIVLRYCVLPFGLNCSPFILGAIVILHMLSYVESNAESKEIVEQFLRDLYMDDETTGTQDLETAIRFYKFVRASMNEGGFDLRKWQSNSSELIQFIQEHEQLFGADIAVVAKSITKILGIPWNKVDDQLIFNFATIINEAISDEKEVTKRIVLKVTHSIFDPLGVLAVFVIILKLLFQEVCSLRCDWDTPLSEEFTIKWRKALKYLKTVDTINEPRCYFSPYKFDNVVKCELHGFCDASKDAYAAVVYIRWTMDDGSVIVRFVACKTKVVPLKVRASLTKEGVPTPNLELLACELLSKLLITIRRSLQCVNKIEERVFCWTDSMDCYYWITNTSKVRKRFVQSRVNKIRKYLPSAVWRHCPGKLNPADLPSRGADLSGEGLRELWLHGAVFLPHDEEFWPETPTETV